MSMAAERTTLVAAVAGFAVLLVLDVLLRRRGRPSWPAVSGTLSIVLALLTLAVAGRWLRESQGPFLTLYDVLLSNLFSLTLVYLLAAWLVPALRASSAIVVAFLGVLGAWSLTVSAEAVPLPATFDNPWLWLHVTAGKLFLGLCLPAAATALWLLARRGTAAAEGGEMDAAVWLTLSLAFVCHSFMLIAGAIWAHTPISSLSRLMSIGVSGWVCEAEGRSVAGGIRPAPIVMLYCCAMASNSCVDGPAGTGSADTAQVSKEDRGFTSTTLAGYMQ